MPIGFSRQNQPAMPREVAELETALKMALPSDYREFLLRQNGGVPETNVFDVPGESNSSGINEFLSISELIEKKRELADRFVPEAIPIAYAEGGNYLCLVLGGRRGVFYWDHELEAADGAPPTWANMFLLAPTFADFLEGLREFDPSKVELKPGQVKKAWIDPDFLKSLKK
jgi:hypothetical protein